MTDTFPILSASGGHSALVSVCARWTHSSPACAPTGDSDDCDTPGTVYRIGSRACDTHGTVCRSGANETPGSVDSFLAHKITAPLHGGVGRYLVVYGLLSVNFTLYTVLPVPPPTTISTAPFLTLVALIVSCSCVAIFVTVISDIVK